MKSRESVRDPLFMSVDALREEVTALRTQLRVATKECVELAQRMARWQETANNNAQRNMELRADLAAAQAACFEVRAENTRLKGSKAGGGRPMTKTIGKTT
jgi:hypothetical protein